MTPKDVTNFRRSDAELEMFWFYCLLVAGKNSDWAAPKNSIMFLDRDHEQRPLVWLKQQGRKYLEHHKTGQYDRLTRAIRESCELNFRTATVDELEAVHGCGPKTARFFILHSRRDAEVAVLDTHILKWLAEKIEAVVPKQTPQNRKRYYAFEQIALRLFGVHFPRQPLADVDMHLWCLYSGRA